VRVENVGPGDTQRFGRERGDYYWEKGRDRRNGGRGSGGKIAEKKIEEFGDFFLAIGGHLSHY
jgi:hypothetical protein